MALVNIINMQVLDNPTAFTNPFQFEVTFECLQELQDGQSCTRSQVCARSQLTRPPTHPTPTPRLASQTSSGK